MSTGNKWVPFGGGSGWLHTDLGSIHRVSGIQKKPTYPRWILSVNYSIDGTNWNAMGGVEDGQLAMFESTVEARYIEVLVPSATRDYLSGVSLLSCEGTL